MAALNTISETIDYADLGLGYCANYNSEGNLFGGRLSPRSPVTIAIVTDALRWGAAGGAQSTATLRNMANYLWWLIGVFGLRAKQEITGGGGGGGTVLPPGGTRGNYFVIIAEALSTDPGDGSLVIGSFVYTDTRLIGGTQLAFIIVNSSIETIASGAFTYDTDSGTIVRINAWQSGDVVQIPFVLA